MAGWDDVSLRNLTQQQFRRAIFHVSGGFYIVVKEDKLQSSFCSLFVTA